MICDDLLRVLDSCESSWKGGSKDPLVCLAGDEGFRDLSRVYLVDQIIVLDCDELQHLQRRACQRVLSTLDLRREPDEHSQPAILGECSRLLRNIFALNEDGHRLLACTEATHGPAHAQKAKRRIQLVSTKRCWSQCVCSFHDLFDRMAFLCNDTHVASFRWVMMF